MTKRELRRQVAALSERLWETEERLMALELRLSEHACDCTRHTMPMEQCPSCWPVGIDPADGWPPSVTVTEPGGH